MKDNDQTVFIVCVPTSWVATAAHPGSIKGVCSDCGVGIWVSIGTQKVLASPPDDREHKVICIGCLPEEEMPFEGAILPTGETLPMSQEEGKTVLEQALDASKDEESLLN